MSRVGHVGRRIQEGSLYVLLFLLPFSKATVEVTSVLLLLGWLLERFDPATRRKTVWLRLQCRPLALAVGTFLAVCAASIAVSSQPSLSLRGFFCKWLEYLWMFAIAADLGVRPAVVRRSSLVIACSSVFVMAEGLTQELFGKGFFRGFKLIVYSRMTGPYENPIDLGIYHMMVTLLLLTYAAVQRGFRRGLVWTVLLFLVVCLGRTLALGVWVATFGAVVLVLMLGHAEVRRFALVLIWVTVFSAGYFLYRTGHTHEVLTLSDIGTADRVAMWTTAIRMISDRPILGHGLNTFMANYLAYWVGGERQPRYAHNCYLQVAAETGLVGLAAFLALLGLLFRQLTAGLRRLSGDDQIILLGLVAGLLAFAIHSAVDTDFYSLRQAALFWVLAGVALGLSARRDEALDAKPSG